MLTKETASEIKEFMVIVAEESANRAIKNYEEHLQKQERDRQKMAIHNTRKLLQNYHRFINHTKITAAKETEIPDLFSPDIIAECMNNKEVVVESILASKKRTIIMINHIKTCIKVMLEWDYSDQHEKRKVFEMFYIDESLTDMKPSEKYEFIAEIIPCTNRTVRNYVNEMIETLSCYLWGIDGLKDKNIMRR